MFSIADVVFYGTQGVCKIDAVETKQIGKNVAQYYVLKPIFNDSTAVYVPVDNATLTAKMQCVLTKEQADALAKEIPYIDLIKSLDENEKRTRYKNILSCGDRKQLVSLIKTIRQERDARKENGKKLNINDEQTLRKAENLLYEELAFVYNVSPQSVKELIKF